MNGDFRSKTSGAWNDIASWEYYNGTSLSWVDASTIPAIPSQNAGTYSVTILATHTITIASDLATLPMGNVFINGTLVLGDSTSNQHITTLSTKLLTIKSTGKLKFSGPKVRLILPASDSVLIIEPLGTIDGNCTNNDEIFVNTGKYATCVGSGSKTYSFGDLIASGGTFNAEITIPTADPSYLAEACNILLLEGINTGSTTGIVSYLWTLVDTDITTGSFTTTNISTITTASFTPIITARIFSNLSSIR